MNKYVKLTIDNKNIIRFATGVFQLMNHKTNL